MADIAFNWSDMESNFENPDYTNNFLHADLADFTKHKERYPEYIWLIRSDHSNYWLLGRLYVDEEIFQNIKNRKKHWITFNPDKSEFYSKPLEVQTYLGEKLTKICNKMFGKGTANGQGAASVMDLQPAELTELKKAHSSNEKISFNEFVAQLKSGGIDGVPFRKGKVKVKSSSTDTLSSKVTNLVHSERLVNNKGSNIIKDEHAIANSVDSSSSSKLELSDSKLDAELISENISSEILDALKLVAKEIDDEYKNKPGKDIDVIVKRRVGQSEFRSLLEVVHGSHCHASLIDNRRLLIASHIVPWSKSTGEEKTDPDNGLLLAVNWDAVFDKGLIGFDDQGKVIFSDDLDQKTSDQLGLDRNVTLRESVLTPGRKKYLQRHRQDVFECWKKAA